MAEMAEIHKFRPGVGMTEGGDGGELNERVVRLETHFEYIRRDLDDIKDSLKGVSANLGKLPTREELWRWKLAWTGIAVASVALIVGGVIGGLAWIKPEPAPSVIQLVPSVPSASGAVTAPRQPSGASGSP